MQQKRKKNYIKNHSEINRRKNITEKKKIYRKLLRNEQKQKIVVINCTKKGAYILIFNGLLQLRNKKKKNKYSKKEKKYKKLLRNEHRCAYRGKST